MKRRAVHRLAATTLLTATGLGTLAQSAHAANYETFGVKFDDTIDLRGTRLQLNGAGTRFRAIFRVYAAALYLPQKATTPQAVLAMPGAKSVRVVMHREIDANELGKLFSRSMEDNASKENFAKTIPGLMKMSNIFSEVKNLKVGDSFWIDYIPNTGTQISVKGRPVGELIREPEFMDSLLRIWFGPKPVDLRLQGGMLGTPPAPNPGAS
jgi:hypothetical protein